jgi:putative CocE/NonD family hydrolase
LAAVTLLETLCFALATLFADTGRVDVLLHRIPELMKEGEVPGVSIVLIDEKKISWHHAFGVANVDTRRPLTNDAIFESASLAKPVFAYAVLKLVDAGVLSLDVPLSHYLKEPVTDERMSAITARMVLTHTTGYQNEVLPGQTLQVHFAPGSRFSYSGAGYFHLQRVVEHLTKNSLPLLMQQLVFRPLGMKNSGYVWLPAYEQRKVYGHSSAGLVAAHRKPTVATVATLHTTPLDYARFMIAVMKGAGLKRETAAAMIATQVPVDASCYSCLTGGSGTMSKTLSWGLGFAVEKTATHTAFWHWGENNGDTQTFAMARADGRGVVVFTNSGNGFSIMPEIVSAVLGGEHPAFAWMGYESYRSPAQLLLRDVLARGSVVLTENATEALTEAQINRLGYALLARKRSTDAVAMFRRNVERFPESFNAYDSLGEAYAAAGDHANAIANYRRSLELNPKNTNAADMIEKLSAEDAPALAPGKWIGAIKAPDQPPLAVIIDATPEGAKLRVFLKNGELREANGRVISGSVANEQLRGHVFIPDAGVQGAITAVRLRDGEAARAQFEALWSDGLLAAESYHALAETAAMRGDVDGALQWLTRARAEKRRMSDALLWSGRGLQNVRRDARFRELHRDPVAAHAELSQATRAIRIEQNVSIAMRDGVTLLADIFRPDEDGRFPVILLRSPYGRGQDVPPDGVGHFAARGYVVVVQSVRGTAGSGGEFVPWVNERRDGYDTIDWVSKQPWSTGRVGMLGLSYLGQAQWAAAVEGHPALQCIIPEVSGSDHFLDTPYDHGILRLSLLPWSRNVMPKPKGVMVWPKLNDDVLAALPLSKLDQVYTGQTLPVWQFLLDADRSEKWSAANFLADLEKVRIPVLHISGWWDGEASSTTYNYRAMRELGHSNQWLIYGPWEHVWNQSSKVADQEYGPTATIDFQSLSVRWFDQWLKQKDVGIAAVPKVQVFVTGANEWRSQTDWPDPQARPVRLYLGQGTLAPRPPNGTTAPDTYRYDPAAVNTNGNGLMVSTTTALQIDPAAKDLLLFESEPFAEATTLSAPGTLDLWFSTSAHDVDFFVVVFDRGPSGAAHALAGPGKMRMRFRNGFDAPQPLTPDEITRGSVVLRPFAHRFEKGHRIGILVRSEWFPSYERNLGTGEPIKNATRMEAATQRIFHDATHPSVLNVWELPTKTRD